MKRLSKSRYTAFCQCPKNLWLKVYKPEEATIDAGMEARFAREMWWATWRWGSLANSRKLPLIRKTAAWIYRR